MLAPLLLLWPMSVVLTWLVAQGLANQPFDRELGDKVRQLAQEVALQRRAAAREARVHAVARARRSFCAPTRPTTFYLPGARPARRAPRRRRATPFACATKIARRPAKCAFATRRSQRRGARGLHVGRGRRTAAPAATPLVQVAETLGKRSRLATEIIKGVILPQFVILPVAVLLVWLALARGIAPLNELQQRIRRRESNDLSPIDENAAPEEVSPLVRAINDLLARLDQSMRAQKHFLADAAHQLKTPLAGLRTQAELAQREIDAGQHDPRR